MVDIMSFSLVKESAGSKLIFSVFFIPVNKALKLFQIIVIMQKWTSHPDYKFQKLNIDSENFNAPYFAPLTSCPHSLTYNWKLVLLCFPAALVVFAQFAYISYWKQTPLCFWRQTCPFVIVPLCHKLHLDGISYTERGGGSNVMENRACL